MLPSWLHFDPSTQTFTGTPGQPDIGSVQVTVTAKDIAGATADTTFTLAVAGAGGGLGDIVLSNTSVDENSDGGTVVGLLSIPDAADGAITYSLSHNPHDAFAIVDGKLVVADGADLDFETKKHYKVTVDATDSAGTHFDEKFTIDIDDVLETPKGTPKPDVLIGDAGNNHIHGKGSDDIIKGKGGDDRLAGGHGNDHLTGNAGADVFILGRHFGHDVVTRFDLDEGDRVNLKHADGIDNFNDLINHHVEDHKHGVLITADDGSSLLLKHVVIDDLKADDFIF